MITWASITFTNPVYFYFTANTNHKMPALTAIEMQEDFKDKFTIYEKVDTTSNFKWITYI